MPSSDSMLPAARGPRVEMAGPLLSMVRKVVPIPVEDELVVRANAVVQVVGGVVLMSGRWQRLAALSIIGSLIPTTAAGHAFWSIEDPLARKIQRTQFEKKYGHARWSGVFNFRHDGKSQTHNCCWLSIFEGDASRVSGLSLAATGRRMMVYKGCAAMGLIKVSPKHAWPRLVLPRSRTRRRICR